MAHTGPPGATLLAARWMDWFRHIPVRVVRCDRDCLGFRSSHSYLDGRLGMETDLRANDKPAERRILDFPRALSGRRAGGLDLFRACTTPVVSPVLPAFRIASQRRRREGDPL